MSLIAAHIAKTAAKHTTHSVIAAHAAKEGARVTTQAGRHLALRSVKSPRSRPVRASHGFAPKSPMGSTQGSQSRLGTTRSSYGGNRGFTGYQGRGGGFAGAHGGFGGFRGR